MTRWALYAAALAVLAAGGVNSRDASAQAASSDDIRFWSDAALPLGHPPADSLRNRNGSPRITDVGLYERFFREHAAALREWSADPRLRLNPNFVAALIAKESGFDPRVTSAVPAFGLTQMTTIGDADLMIISRQAPAFQWMHGEVRRWPRAAMVRAGRMRQARIDSLLASGAISGRNEYFFDPRLALRAAMFWLRVLADVWRSDEWPGQYGTLARQRLGADARLGDRDLLELVAVSYNQGHPYVAALVRQHGRDWKDFLNDESRDYLERVVLYTRIFQRAAKAAS